MAARELLAELEELGFSVAADGENLLIRPASALTEELRGWLRACKADLLEALQAPIDPKSPPPLVARLMRWGWSEDEAKALAQRIAERDQADDRRLCVTCHHYQPGRCRNPRAAGLSSASIGRQWAEMHQRCAGYLERHGAALDDQPNTSE